MRALNKHNAASSGFTILELMIATTILAVVLLVVAAGIVSFTHDYFKGVTNAKTQDAARNVISDIAQNVQFANTVGHEMSGPEGVHLLCIGSKQYLYVIGRETTDTTSALVKDSSGKCLDSDLVAPTPSSLSASRQEMLGDHMRLGELSVSGDGTLKTIRVTVIYGDDDLLQHNTDSPGALPDPSDADAWRDVHCAITSGSQFCSVATLETSVQQRIGM